MRTPTRFASNIFCNCNCSNNPGFEAVAQQIIAEERQKEPPDAEQLLVLGLKNYNTE